MLIHNGKGKGIGSDSIREGDDYFNCSFRSQSDFLEYYRLFTGTDCSVVQISVGERIFQLLKKALSPFHR